MKRVKHTQHAAVHSMDARQLTEFASCSESAAPVHASTKSDHAQWLTPAHGQCAGIRRSFWAGVGRSPAGTLASQNCTFCSSAAMVWSRGKLR